MNPVILNNIHRTIDIPRKRDKSSHSLQHRAVFFQDIIFHVCKNKFGKYLTESDKTVIFTCPVKIIFCKIFILCFVVPLLLISKGYFYLS